MNKQHTAQVLAYLSAAFPHVNLSRETAVVYHDLLNDLEFDPLMACVRELLATAEFFPSPAVLRKKYAQDSGLLAPSSSDAWGEVMQKARDEGRIVKSLTFSHPAVTAVVQSLGWYDICMSTNQDTLRAHFLRLYESKRSELDATIVSEGIRSLSAPASRAQLAVRAGEAE